ncbi:MAG: hypothetical protein HQL52_15270 [Magnetococcales bacterium]|nr:hypothetical protein [Magnetococcales bacterium]
MSLFSQTRDFFQASQRARLNQRLESAFPFLKHLSFLAGLFIFSFFFHQLSLTPYDLRQLPPEADDVYAYALRGMLLEECLTDPCGGVEEIKRRTLDEGGEIPKNLDELTLFLRLSHLGPPLHPALMTGFHALGLDWLASYQAVGVLTFGLLVVGVAGLLWVLVGPGAAGVGLFLLGVHIFRSQGLTLPPVPGRLALGIALIAWWLIVALPKPRPSLSLFWVILLLLTHPIGVALGGVTAGFHAWVAFPKRPGEAVGVFVTGAVLVVSVWLAPRFLSHPELFFQPLSWFPADPAWQGWAGIKHNIAGAQGTLLSDAGLYGGILPWGVALLVGWLTLTRARRYHLTGILLGVAGLLGLSLVIIFPGHEASVFNRIWVPFAILLAGIFGRGAWSVVAFIPQLYATWRKAFSPREALPPQTSLSLPWPTLALVTLLWFAMSATIAWSGFQHQYQGYFKHHEMHARFLLRQDHAPDWEQPRLLTELFQEGDLIRYGDIVTLSHYLLAGAQDIPALFDASPRASLEPGVRFIAVQNPLLGKKGAFSWPGNFRQGGFQLQPGGWLGLSAERPISWRSLKFRVQNPSQQAVTLSWRAWQDGFTSPPDHPGFSVPPGADDWFILAEPPGTGERFQLYLPVDSSQLVRIKGIRTDGLTRPRFPWGSGIRLHFDRKAGFPSQWQLRFDGSSFSRWIPLGHDAQVIADGGFTLLLELDPYDHP